MPQADGGQFFDDVIDALRAAGVTPQRFASFVQSFTGSEPSMPKGDNFPGFEYIDRVSTSAWRALTAHAQLVNASWSNLRQGRYPLDAAMQSWTRIVENYYGVFAEALRGPTRIVQPVWLVIPYTKGAGQSPD